MGDTRIDDEALDTLRARARRDVDEGLLPACQWALAVDGEVVATETVGDVPAGDASRFVMYSCTKAVVAAAIWQLLGEGSLDLDQKVVDLVPEFGTNGKDVVTVEQVLLHTAGFPRAPLHPAVDRAGRLAAFGRWRLDWEPGSRYEYHPTAAHWVLAELLERIDGEDFRAAVRRRVLDPLGLQRLSLGVPPADQGDIARPVSVGDAPTRQEWRDALGVDGYDVGEVTDDALVALGSEAGIAAGVPGGGGVSDAVDLARFYQGLLRNAGGLWDPAVLADATGNVRNTFPDPQTGVTANRALSIVVAGDDGAAGMRGMGHTCSPRAFGHNGAGGQIAFADPATGASFAWFTNGLDRHTIRQWRRAAGIASKAGSVVRPSN